MAQVLVLGGARETGQAARALEGAGHAVRVYWAREVSDPDLNRCESLRGGIAWADGLLDTTHVFDRDTRAIARALAPALAACRFGRAPWQADAQDRWTPVPDLAAAVAALPAGATVFAATGRDSAELLAHHDGPVHLRQLHAHEDVPPPNCTFVFGTGPFDVAQEMELFERLHIDVILARNIGGAGSFPKVAAARAMGLPVVMIEPEAHAFGPPVTTLDAVLSWAAAL